MMDADVVWDRVLELMPVCSCGVRLRPGGVADQQLLVCTGCSSVSVADPVWVVDVVAQARREVAARG